MRSLTRSNSHPQIDAFIYSKLAELLLIGLLLVFIYPFFFVISGMDPTIPIPEQSETKLVYFLQMVLPFFCIAIGLMSLGSEIFLPGAIVIYPVVCLASTAWSVGPYDTFKFASLMLIYILAVASLCQLLDIRVVCKIIVKLLVFLILASVVMALVVPKYGMHQADDELGDVHIGLWRGVFTHKNQLGPVAAAGVFVSLFFSRFISDSIGFRLVVVVAAIACLVFAESAGAWVTLVTLVVYYCLVVTLPVSRNFLVLIVCGVSALVFASYSFLVPLIGRDLTFTGRTEIWSIVLDGVWQKPLLGYGYTAAREFIRPFLVAQAGSAAVDPHNGYLDVLLGTGIVGLAVFVTASLLIVLGGIDRVKMSAGRETDCFMLLSSLPILSLINSFFETEAIAGVQGLGAFTFLALTAAPMYLRLECPISQSSASAEHRDL